MSEDRLRDPAENRKGVPPEKERAGEGADRISVSELSSAMRNQLLSFVTRIGPRRDLRRPLWELIRHVAVEHHWNRITLYRFQPDPETVEAWISSDASHEWQTSLSLFHYPELTLARNQGKPVFIPRITHDLFLQPTRDRIRQAGFCSIYVVPILASNVSVGALTFKSLHHRVHLKDLEVRYFALLADLISFVFPQEKTDPLTRLNINELHRCFSRFCKESSGGFLTLDPHGMMTEVNPPFASLLKYDPGEMTGKSLFHFLFPGDYDRVRQTLKDLTSSRTGMLRQTLSFLTRHGQKISMEISVMADPLLSDRVLVITSRGEETDTFFANRKEYRETLRALIWEAPDYVTISDVDGRYLVVNKALCHASGYLEREFLSEDFPGISTPEEKECFRKDHERMLRGEKMLPRLGHMKTKSGELIPIEIQAHAVTYDRQPVAMMTIARDMRSHITSREKEEYLKEELNRKIQELSEVNRQLEEERDFRYTFISSAAHHLKTPISTLKAALETFLTDVAPQMPQKSDELFEPAWESLRRVESLSHNLLDLTDLQSREIPITRERFSLRKLLLPMLKELKPLCFKKSLSLRLDAGAEDFMMETDRVKLQQVIDTLLTNAVYNSPERGEITLKMTRERGTILLSVTNEGRGLTEGERKRIFIPFLHRERADGRHGLGLSLAQTIMDLLGGSLHVESEPGEGTCFTIEIPANENS